MADGDGVFLPLPPIRTRITYGVFGAVTRVEAACRGRRRRGPAKISRGSPRDNSRRYCRVFKRGHTQAWRAWDNKVSDKTTYEGKGNRCGH